MSNLERPEIMCSSMDCPIKETCYRYMAHPSIDQNFQEFQHEGRQVLGSLEPPITDKVTCIFRIPLYEDEYK